MLTHQRNTDITPLNCATDLQIALHLREINEDRKKFISEHCTETTQGWTVYKHLRCGEKNISVSHERKKQSGEITKVKSGKLIKTSVKTHQ